MTYAPVKDSRLVRCGDHGGVDRMISQFLGSPQSTTRYLCWLIGWKKIQMRFSLHSVASRQIKKVLNYPYSETRIKFIFTGTVKMNITFEMITRHKLESFKKKLLQTCPNDDKHNNTLHYQRICYYYISVRISGSLVSLKQLTRTGYIQHWKYDGDFSPCTIFPIT